jgi:hypothetical protein
MFVIADKVTPMIKIGKYRFDAWLGCIPQCLTEYSVEIIDSEIRVIPRRKGIMEFMVLTTSRYVIGVNHRNRGLGLTPL